MAKIAVSEVKNGSKNAVAFSTSMADERTQIASLAYQFFVDRGCQDGFDQEDWLRAEAIIRNKKK